MKYRQWKKDSNDVVYNDGIMIVVKFTKLDEFSIL